MEHSIGCLQTNLAVPSTRLEPRFDYPTITAAPDRDFLVVITREFSGSRWIRTITPNRTLNDQSSAIVETYTPILPYSAFTRACNRLINQAALRQSPPGTGREVNSARRLVAQYALLRTVVLSSWSLACKNPREVIFAISYERYPAA